jgi:hypothetical protein
MGMFWAMSIPGLLTALFAFAVVEKVVRRVRRGRSGAPVLSGAGFDQVTMLFYATKQLELDQRQADLMTRDEEEDGAPPRGPIDLDTGVVLLKPSPAAQPPRPSAG